MSARALIVWAKTCYSSSEWTCERVGSLQEAVDARDRAVAGGAAQVIVTREILLVAIEEDTGLKAGLGWKPE